MTNQLFVEFATRDYDGGEECPARPTPYERLKRNSTIFSVEVVYESGNRTLTSYMPRPLRYRSTHARRRRSPRDSLSRRTGFVESLEPRCLLAVSLGGQVFDDFNGNQRWEPNAPQNEPACECWTVYLDLNQDGVHNEDEPYQRTAADGSYRFDSLAAGTYTINLASEPGYDRSTPIHFGSSTSLVAGSVRDHVFDPSGNILYATSGDRILRRDAKTGKTLASLAVGTKLTAIDVTPDGKYLLVGEGEIDAERGLAFLYKINLSDDTVTTISFPTLRDEERGVFDLVAVSDSRVLLTTAAEGTPYVPLRELDLGTDKVSLRKDALTGGEGLIRPDSRLDRDASRHAVLLLEAHDVTGPVALYDPATNTITRSTQLNSLLDDARVSISRDGRLFAVETATLGIKVLSDQFHVIQSLPHFRGGVAFDPFRDILYAGDTGHDELVAIGTVTWTELYRVAVGEDLPESGMDYEMQTSARGRFLSLATPSGVRYVTLDRPVPHVVTATDNAAIEQLDFGSWWNGLNRRPRTSADSYAIKEDSVLQVVAPGVLSNDSDPDGDPFTAVVDSLPQFGVLELQPDGSVRYRPNQNYFGTDQFTYHTDDGSLRSCLRTVTLQVLPVNDAPTGIQISGSTVAENAAGADLGAVVVQDVDGNDEFTFIVSDPRFEIVNGRLRLRPGVFLDHEAAATFPLTITATDNGSPPLSVSATIAITVTDVNEFDPTIDTTSIDVNEGESTVGTVHVHDNDSSQTITISIVGGNELGIFQIDPGNGVITLAENRDIDYEETSVYVLNVAVEDDGKPSRTSTAEITIHVQDVNEYPPIINDVVFVVDENSTIIGQVPATDGDTDQTVTFSILASQDSLFTIDPQSGEIRVVDGRTLDYEQGSEYQLTVAATDSGNPAKTAFASVTVKVRDVNEFAPLMPDQLFHVAENPPAGTVVGRMAASDGDIHQELSFAIIGGNQLNAFDIDPITGHLFVVDGSAIDREMVSQFVLEIAVADSGSPSRSTSARATIVVDGVSEYPTTIENQTFAIAENSPAGTVVGMLVVQDLDVGDSHRFTVLGGSGAAVFAVSSSGQITVIDASALDYETVQSLQLTVEVRENGPAGAGDIAEVTIQLTDQNEFDPLLENQTVHVWENSAAGYVVAQVLATDGDIRQTISYSITAGNDALAFEMDPATGQIRVANPQALDYEVTQQIVLGVTATDSGTPANSTTVDIILDIDDVNEGPPVADDQSFQVAENVSVGTLVGNVMAIDPDRLQSLTYTMLGGNTAGAFSLDSHTGQLTVAGPLDYEVRSSYRLTVQVTDSGNPAQSDTATVTIDVSNANDPPTRITLDNQQLREQVFGAPVGHVFVQDQDINDQHMLTVDDVRFEITAGRELKLRSDVALPAGSVGPITLSITATDLAGASLTQAFAISISTNSRPWQNERDPRDVNNDGSVTQHDALVVINEINGHRHSDPLGRLPVPRPDIPGLPYYDVNGDGFVTVIDVLIIVNRLNTATAESGGEGESVDNDADEGSFAFPPAARRSEVTTWADPPLGWSAATSGKSDEDSEAPLGSRLGDLESVLREIADDLTRLRLLP